jgi:hypothetical protein
MVVHSALGLVGRCHQDVPAQLRRAAVERRDGRHFFIAGAAADVANVVEQLRCVLRLVYTCSCLRSLWLTLCLSRRAGNSLSAIFAHHQAKSAAALTRRQLLWLFSQIQEPCACRVLTTSACAQAIVRLELPSRLLELLDGCRRAFSAVDGRTVFRSSTSDTCPRHPGLFNRPSRFPQ